MSPTPAAGSLFNRPLIPFTEMIYRFLAPIKQCKQKWRLVLRANQAVLRFSNTTSSSHTPKQLAPTGGTPCHTTDWSKTTQHAAASPKSGVFTLPFLDGSAGHQQKPHWVLLKGRVWQGAAEGLTCVVSTVDHGSNRKTQGNPEFRTRGPTTSCK